MTKIQSLDNFKKYKKALVVTKELEEAIYIITLTIQGLSKHYKYKPVMDILTTLRNNKTIMEIHYANIMRIVENKGDVKGDSRG